MATPKGIPTLLGAILGGYVGWRFKKPLAGAVAGAVLGSVGTMKAVQGPAEGKRMGWGTRQYPWEGYGYVTPASLFSNASYAVNLWGAPQLGNSLSVLVASLGRATPSSINDFNNYFANAIMVGQKETGKQSQAGDGSWGGRELNAFVKTIPKPPPFQTLTAEMTKFPRGGASARAGAPFFAMLKRFLLAKGATRTAAAVTSAARRYYYNIERGSSSSSRPSTSSSSSRPSTSSSSSSPLTLPASVMPDESRVAGLKVWWSSRSTISKLGIAIATLGIVGGVGYYAFARPKSEMAR